MNDVFKAASQATAMSSEFDNPDLEVLPPPKREGNCFQCCFPKKNETSRDGDVTHLQDVEKKRKEEEKVEETPRDFDLPDLGEDEFHDSTEGKPADVETQANIVLTFCQFIMSMIFFEFLERNRKRKRAITQTAHQQSEPMVQQAN